jgi:RNA polymerase sigma-70 factor (ECF subfamily)
VDPAQEADRRRRFERLVTAVYEPVQRYLLRRTDPAAADDVLGDVLLVLWRRLDDVPSGNPLPWVYGVARGCLANNRRSIARQERLVHRLALVRLPDEGTDDGTLEQALDALPAADREVLRLWAWEQLPPRALGVALGVSANAASIRLHRAKRRLRRVLTSGKDSGPTGQIGMRDGGGAAR